jgi:D-alanyl-lipoteichoic acid acyltransferase DltB (MBOAT superfamily)
MLFPTVEFALFFLFSLLVSWSTVRHHALHKTMLLVLSYVFYGLWNWHFLPLLFIISLYGWIASLGIASSRRPRVWLVLGISACLLTLAWYKYLLFFAQNLMNLAAFMDKQLILEIESTMLPLGISFMSFHAISLMMDVSRGKLRTVPSLPDVLLYVAFFPQLIAGPILRASQFMPQLDTAPNPNRIETSRALMLIAVGLFKKVVLANSLATLLVDDVFTHPAGSSASQTLLGIYGYAAQIYCDFSGYTDIAIGCALLLGYRFPDNFNNPYLSATPQEFWRRWHISLSIWLREYLFIPLGGSREGQARTLISLMLTMLLGGLWHGAAWNFIIWGTWHGILLCVHRVWDDYWSARNDDAWRYSKAWLICSRLLLFHAVCLAWIFFRASDFEGALAVINQLFVGAWRADLSLGMLICVGLGIGLQYIPERFFLRLQYQAMQIPVWALGALFALALTVIEVLGPSAPAPFIYFQF